MEGSRQQVSGKQINRITAAAIASCGFLPRRRLLLWLRQETSPITRPILHI